MKKHFKQLTLVIAVAFVFCLTTVNGMTKMLPIISVETGSGSDVTLWSDEEDDEINFGKLN